MHTHSSPYTPDMLTEVAATRALLQALPLGICTVDPAGRILSLNAEAERLLGWGETACGGMALHDLLACWLVIPDTTQATCPITQVLSTGRPVWTACTTIQCRDGSSFPVEYTCMPLPPVGSARAVVSFRDLRNQLQTEQELVRLASVPKESPLPIVELDAEAHLIYANPAMIVLMEQCGFGQNALPAVLPPDMARIAHECIRAGESHQGLEGGAAGKYFAWTFCPIPQTGLLRGYGVDLTERKQAEQTLREARDAVLEAWRLKSEFLANISHELRTPLNGIIGLTELILDTPLMPEQYADLVAVREASDTLLALVDNLLGCADLETGRLVLKQEAFSLRATLSAALQPLAQRAQHKGLTLATQIAPELVDTLLGDRDRLCQILVSLINNAMKFTAQGGITVRVTLASQSADEVVLHWTVTDTGIGIPEGQQRLIFEAFRQGDGSSTRLYGGVGLGLTIAAHLVAMMGGDIWVESAGHGTGSTFHFTTRFGVQPTAVLQSPQVSVVVSDLADCTHTPANLPQ
jgi:two-component system, sensor histidine kinase and response regulator